MDIKDYIKRNSNNFSFVDTLASFVNNYQWNEGYREYQTGNYSEKGYLWSVLSSIGNEYSEVIYENVLNYINNVSNIDLCKVKALKSITQILGVKYQIFDNTDKIPIEILNLLDLLSVNKHYLLDNKTFVSAFFDQLSSSGCLLEGTNNTLSNEVLDINNFKLNNIYIDYDAYEEFIQKVFIECINNFIRMKYADAEAGLSTENDYIYEYIADELIDVQTTSDELVVGTYDQQIQELKIKYKLSKDFKPSEIVDNIENLTDFIDNYNANEQEVIQVEIQKRQDVYSSAKSFKENEKFLGYNLTRYSYYREKKVKEYFSYVQNIYNNLITKKDIEDASTDSSGKVISQYDKDPNYFNINQTVEEKLISLNRDTQTYAIQDKMIIKIAELLQQQVFELVEIREQLKIQLQKQYMKGTFLLLSYVINEFLKYNISNKYGEDIYTTDGSISLKEILDKSISKGDNVQLIEYIDPTEYYNIERDNDISAKNGEYTNQKYWENEYNTIGVNTNDIPIDEIQQYYIKQLQLDKKGISDITEFLSIIFEYGANSSFQNKDTEEFTCIDQNGNYLNDVDSIKVEVSAEIIEAQNNLDKINEYIEEGCSLTSSDSISTQITQISSWCFNKYQTQIDNNNSTKYQEISSDLNNSLIQLSTFNIDFYNISSDYKDTLNSEELSSFLTSYSEYGNIYLKDKLSCFKASCDAEVFDFSNNELLTSLTASPNGIKPTYNNIQIDMDAVINLSVKSDSGLGYSSYTNDTDSELDSQSQTLISYLNTKIQSLDDDIFTHQQTHLTKLISYKNDVNTMIKEFNQVSATYELIKQEIFNKTVTSCDAGFRKYVVWNPNRVAITQNDGTYWTPYGQLVYFSDGHKLSVTYSWNSLTNSLIDNITELNNRCKNDIYHIKIDGQIAEKKLGAVSTCNHYASDPANTYQILDPSSTFSSIKTGLNNLINDFKSIKTFINTELNCLGDNIGSISINDPTVDDIGDKLQNLYINIIEKINKLDSDYIKLKNKVDTDKYKLKFDEKVNLTNKVISTLTASMDEEEISSIQGRYEIVKQDFSDLRDEHKGYLTNYSYVDFGKISDQVDKLVSWINTFSVEKKTGIKTTANNLTSSYDSLRTSILSFINSEKLYKINSINSDISYEVSSWTNTYINQYINELINLASCDVNENLNITLPESKNQVTKEYITKNLINDDLIILESIKKSISNSLSKKILINDELQNLLDELNKKNEYLESQREWYYNHKLLFLTYNGTEIGIDPYYNHKNITHPSYQIHPYLYNFIEKTNTIYPIANTFFLAFTNSYESDLVEKNIDTIVGNYGNILNLWKSELYDCSGYRTDYEKTHINLIDSSLKNNGIVGFTGLFYPPALEAFLENPDDFIYKVKNNSEDSYYFHLNLTQDQLNKIAEQLTEYEKPIRLVTQKRNSIEEQVYDGYLSGEYDIYKYGQDAYGNSLILLKNYNQLYYNNQDIPNYTPSFNEKKNTLGELWMRIKNHPIAFPAFDLRSSYEDLSQYVVNEQVGNSTYELNKYIKYLNSAYNNIESMKDSIGITCGYQFLKCFYDMEFEPSNRVVLLNVPYYTGFLANKQGSRSVSLGNMSYANSSIIVGVLEQNFDYQQNMTLFSFTMDSYGNIDNIPNKGMILLDDVTTNNERIYEFLGFNTSSNYIYCLFIEKEYLGSGYPKLFPKTESNTPVIRIKPYGYKYHQKLYSPSTNIIVSDLKFNIFDKSKISEIDINKYKYVDNVVSTCDGNIITIAYISEQVQPPDSTKIKTKDDPYTKNNTTVITYPEYTNIVENNEQTMYGSNISYPSSTAILQTDDDQHIVIYNSFDSFTSYIVMIQLEIIGHTINYHDTKYFNLNTDIGFIPLFANDCGKTRFYNNSKLLNKDQYNIELLGPEKADVDSTPVIVENNSNEESYGRVSEDYKEQNKFKAYNKEISINPLEISVSYVFELSNVLSDIYEDITQTNQLLQYKYLLLNDKYQSIPIVKGQLSSILPLQNLYSGSEAYDIIIGEELIGPNGISFQNIGSSNHINNISSIDVNVNFDYTSLLPKSISLTCQIRNIQDIEQKISENQFQLIVYNKNNIKSYDYYHLFQNSNQEVSSILSEQLSGNHGITQWMLELIDFNEINSLSLYSIPGTTIKPFKNYAESTKINELSSLLEFKYSEEYLININKEFPYINSNEVEDDIVVTTEDNQYYYFFALDNFNTINLKPFYMEKYNVSTHKYETVEVNTTTGSYEDFYNNSLTLQVTYNVEVVDESKKGLPGYYGIILYFNYKNYSSPQYINYTRGSNNEPPTWEYCKASDKSIKNTYLILKPGESGKIQIRVDHVEFDKLNQQDISYNVVGKETKIIATYYIINISQDKPKFKISREPFSLN